MATWRDFEKKAQLWGYYAPAHGSPSSEAAVAEGVAKGVGKGLSSAAGGAMGALIGAGNANKAHGWGSLTDWGKFKDSLHMIGQGARVGAQVGWRDADRVANDAKVTAGRIANNFGLYGDDKVLALQKENDKKILEQIGRANSGGGYKFPVPDEPPKDEKGLLVPVTDANGNEDPQYAEYNNYIKWARGGQDVADYAGTAAATIYAGRLLGWGGRLIDNKIMNSRLGPLNGLEKLRRFVNPPAPARLSFSAAGKALPAAAFVGTDTYGRFTNSLNSDDGAKERFDSVVDKYLEMDPSSDEARRTYELLKSQKDLNPDVFDQLEPPRPASAESPAPPTGAQAPAQPAANGWSMSPELQNMLGYGLGGALLGGLFGGKGSWWKWALLASILGAFRNSGGFEKAWNGISSLWNGQKK